MNLTAPAGPNLGSFALLALLMSATPGPNMAYVFDVGCSAGARAALAGLGGIAVAYVFYLALAALGLGSLAHHHPFMLGLLQLGGGAYMFFLSWRIQAGGRTATSPEAGRPMSGRGTFFNGLVTNLANPANLLLYVTIIPQFMGVVTEPRELMISTVLLGVIFIICALLANGSAALAGAWIGPSIRVNNGFLSLQRWLLSSFLAVMGWVTLMKLFA